MSGAGGAAFVSRRADMLGDRRPGVVSVPAVVAGDGAAYVANTNNRHIRRFVPA